MNWTVLLFAFLGSFCHAFSTSTLRRNHQLKVMEKELTSRSIHPKDIASEEMMSRRESMSQLRSISLSGLLLAIPNHALATPPTGADTRPTGAEAFVGTYSDPVNHPGGTRTIKLLENVGDYTLAEVTGGGGKGEPANFVLPAIVAADRFIIIDFSSKGGPKDFTGVLQKDGGIKFAKDGNSWPRD